MWIWFFVRKAASDLQGQFFGPYSKIVVFEGCYFCGMKITVWRRIFPLYVVDIILRRFLPVKAEPLPNEQLFDHLFIEKPESKKLKWK